MKYICQRVKVFAMITSFWLFWYIIHRPLTRRYRMTINGAMQITRLRQKVNLEFPFLNKRFSMLNWTDFHRFTLTYIHVQMLISQKSYRLKNISFYNTEAHCSKSSFFVQKFNFDFPRKIVELFWVKTRENVVVLDFLAVDNFDFTRKIVKKIWVKNSWKCRGFVKIEFLDINLTFRIVCEANEARYICFKNETFLEGFSNTMGSLKSKRKLIINVTLVTKEFCQQ